MDDLRALRPSVVEAVRQHRTEVVDVMASHGMSHPRLFGSGASGRDSEHSDVDLLVDVADCTDLLDIIDAADELESLLGRRVDLVTSRSLWSDHEIIATAVPW